MERQQQAWTQLGLEAELLKAMAHPARLCILRGLLETGGCNVSHMQSCLDLPQSTVSQHLAKLRSSGLIIAHRQGVEVHYTVSHPQVKALLHTLFPN